MKIFLFHARNYFFFLFSSVFHFFLLSFFFLLSLFFSFTCLLIFLAESRWERLLRVKLEHDEVPEPLWHPLERHPEELGVLAGHVARAGEAPQQGVVVGVHHVFDVSSTDVV